MEVERWIEGSDRWLQGKRSHAFYKRGFQNTLGSVMDARFRFCGNDVYFFTKQSDGEDTREKDEMMYLTAGFKARGAILRSTST